MNFAIKLFFTIGTIFYSCFSFALSDSTTQSIFASLMKSDFDQIIISSDFDQLRTNRMTLEDQEATFIFQNSTDKIQQLKGKVEVRGKYRRRKCEDMPPLRLNFKKKSLRKYNYSDKYKKYKLVTYCLDQAESDQAVLKEYWIYRLYNELTPNSFKVKLLEVIYENTTDNSHTRYMGFLIESNKELSDRLAVSIKKKWGLTRDSIQSTNYHEVLLFQYMIGNLDWDLPMLRNLVIASPKDKSSLPIIIPYDFDISGLVDASYAVPNSNFKQTSVKQRVVVDNFNSEQMLQQIRDRFKKLYEEDWCFEGCPFLSSASKKEMTRYLKKFEKMMENERKLNDLFLD